MRIKTLLTTLIFVFLYFFSHAQYSLEFTINQLPSLLVNAGKDTLVTGGAKIKLGSSSTASGGSGVYTYSWTPATGLDNPAVANPEATITSTITYEVKVTDSAGCQKTDQVQVTVQVPTGLPAIVYELGLTIFPNPSNGKIYIISQQSIADKNIELVISDILGRIVFTKTIAGGRRLNEAIELSRAMSGIYLIRLKSTRLNVVYKIVLQ